MNLDIQVASLFKTRRGSAATDGGHPVYTYVAPSGSERVCIVEGTTGRDVRRVEEKMRIAEMDRCLKLESYVRDIDSRGRRGTENREKGGGQRRRRRWRRC